MTPSFSAWRRDVRFEKVKEPPIKPLIEELDFIENKVQWGYKFRFGVIKIEEHDFQTIRKAMEP